MAETSRTILTKVEAANEKLAAIGAPESVFIEPSYSLTEQQLNIQPASDWLNEYLEQLNVTISKEELIRLLNEEIAKLRKYITDKITEMAEEFAAKAAEKAAEVLAPIPIPKIPPIVEQIEAKGRELQETLETKILTMTINMELRKDIMIATQIKNIKKLKKSKQDI
jgi:hypothetical protein